MSNLPETPAQQAACAISVSNSFIFLRTSVEPQHLWVSPQNIWLALMEYVTAAQEYPLVEEKVFGTGYRAIVHKVRALSIKGFCIFVNCTERTFDKMGKDEAFAPIIEQIRAIIYTQKFEAAAADLLNPALIKSDLGLADKQEFSGPGGSAMKITAGMSAQEAADEYQKTLIGE